MNSPLLNLEGKILHFVQDDIGRGFRKTIISSGEKINN